MIELTPTSVFNEIIQTIADVVIGLTEILQIIFWDCGYPFKEFCLFVTYGTHVNGFIHVDALIAIIWQIVVVEDLKRKVKAKRLDFTLVSLPNQPHEYDI